MGATQEIQYLRSLSTLYSNATLRDILSEETLSPIKKRISKYKSFLFSDSTPISFGEFLAELYKQMCKHYCNEYVYKNIVFENISNKYSLHTTTLLNELKICKSIADLVLINGEVKVYELKTELDTLSRLDVQLVDYKKVAEKVNIVASYKFLNQIECAYGNTSFGIIKLEENLDLTVIKEPQIDRSCFEYEPLFNILRKSEYTSIIEKYFGCELDFPNTVHYKRSLLLAKEIPINDFQSLVFSELKQRKTLEPDLLLDVETPKELRFLCHSLNLKVEQYHKLSQLLKTNV